jgi:hypothetical protein
MHASTIASPTLFTFTVIFALCLNLFTTPTVASPVPAPQANNDALAACQVSFIAGNLSLFRAQAEAAALGEGGQSGFFPGFAAVPVELENCHDLLRFFNSIASENGMNGNGVFPLSV